MKNIAETTPRPKCRQCGKQLSEVWHATDWATEHYGRDPIKTKPAKQYVGSLMKLSDLGFYGNYGYEGNNNFCTLRCGFKWANYQIRNGRL